MKLKAVLAPVPAWVKLFFLAAVAILLTGIGATLYASFVGTSDPASPAFLRGLQLTQGITLFLLPAFICSWLFSPEPLRYLSLDRAPGFFAVFRTLLLLLAAMPFLNAVIAWNAGWKLPVALQGVETWMQTQESLAKTVTDRLLEMDSVGSLFVAVGVIAVLAGVGEELLFRGVVQRIFGQAFRNPHLAVWSTALLFSAVHLQFYGFVPRLLLGAFFGYLLLWSGSIYLPVFAHFLNNLLGVLSAWFEQRGVDVAPFESFGTAADGTLWAAGLSLFLTAGLLIGLYRHIRTGASG